LKALRELVWSALFIWHINRLERLHTAPSFAAKFLFHQWHFCHSELFQIARQSVEEISSNVHLREAAGREERTRFCPRCGQIPDGDRRMDEARERFLQDWKGSSPKRSEDFGLLLAQARRGMAAGGLQ
jgi:hypothetical protein